MSRVVFKTTPESTKAFRKLAIGDGIASALEAVAAPVLEAARNDSNSYYVSTLRSRRHISVGGAPRVSIRIGAKHTIGVRVESERGTLARALTNAGV